MENKNKYGFTISEFDIEEPPMGHHQRFMDKLNGNRKQKKPFPYRTVLSIAATIVVLLGVWMNFSPITTGQPTAKLSKENKEAQDYFNGIIRTELAALKLENAPGTKPILDDAFRQLKKLDNDYNKLMKELAEKGENSQIIHAMITNLQTRISFLEKVATQIDNIKKFKSKSS